MTGRVFGASLKPVWNEQKIEDFLNKTKGDMTVFIINHDKDKSEAGEIVEAHTHIYLEYKNPRKITTIANLLEVDANFIEVVRNKKGYLRYLTHMDEKDKHRYEVNEVFTNSSQSYEITVQGNAMTDKDIAEMLKQGRGIELLGVVSASRLRTIQSFIHFDSSNILLEEIRALRGQMSQIVEIADNVETITKNAVDMIENGLMSMADSFGVIATEMTKVRKVASRKRN